MAEVKAYLLSITAAAVVCTILRHIAGEKGTTEKIIRIITGVFMAVTLVSPLLNFNLKDIERYFSDFQAMSADAAETGTQMANAEMTDIIKLQTEAYILDKARQLGLEIDVEVKLSESNPPVPCHVVLTGTVSPYQKRYISQHISDKLGISQENQQWN